MAENVDEFIRDDWFAPAVIANGSVDNCLNAVESLLEKKVSNQDSSPAVFLVRGILAFDLNFRDNYLRLV